MAQQVVAFDYRAPSAKNVRRMQDLSDGCKELAETAIELVPACAERTLAIRKLQEFRMWINCALVFDGQDSIFGANPPEEQGEPPADPQGMFIDNHPARQPFVYDRTPVIPAKLT